MRYPLGVLFLASCTMLTPLPTEHIHIEQPAPVMKQDPRKSSTETHKPKPRQPSSPASASEISTCANLDAGDLKETIRAKLDCITENAR